MHAVFPGMQISVEAGIRIDDSGPQERLKSVGPYYPDALADEWVYRVSGPAANAAERCASEDFGTPKFSQTRQVRFELFRWPGEAEAGLLAVLQYKFLDANPSPACWSLGLLVHLVSDSGNWQRHDEYLLETQHHGSVQRIELIDLAGSRTPQLVIESGLGGGAALASTLQVFELGKGGFEELVNEFSRLEDFVPGTEAVYTQVLDVPTTLKLRAQRFCVVKTTFMEDDTWLRTPLASHPCYQRGEGIDPEDVKRRQQMLSRVK